MTALQLTAMTDFILAALAFFCAGALAARPAQSRSAGWYWRATMFCLALAALLGGIDHGFFEESGLPRTPIQRATWVVVGLMTSALLLTLGAQFLSPARQGLVRVVAAVQLLAYLLAIAVVDSFIVVVINYLPVILAMLAFNLRGMRQGSGHWTLALGIAVLLLASTVQALGYDGFSPIDHNVLYHLISMPGVVLLYLGSRYLKTKP